MSTSPLSWIVDVVDEAEIDDVDAELGIEDLRERASLAPRSLVRTRGLGRGAVCRDRRRIDFSSMSTIPARAGIS